MSTGATTPLDVNAALWLRTIGLVCGVQVTRDLRAGRVRCEVVVGVGWTQSKGSAA